MTKVILTCEGKKIEVDIEVAEKSTILKNMIEDTGKDGEIPIPNIRESILRKVLEYCEHYRSTQAREIPKPLPNKNLEEAGVDSWDCEFIEMENMDDLIDLVVASNFLDIEGLLNLGCAKVASLIKGKNVEEIRDLFGIENDFTPEEEAQIREENKWAEEAI